ncbi:MAG TPA: phosphate/phosphite/phosphonate ABC transporter substrate-binding protein [Firmicutes bacterium]|nr:phosphate/phosphite/phosphonate ABC transporter substrate-binding protein [Bacillota bacterium]
MKAWARFFLPVVFLGALLAAAAFSPTWDILPALLGFIAGGGAGYFLFRPAPVPSQGQMLDEKQRQAGQEGADFLGMAENLGFAAKQLLWNAEEMSSASRYMLSLSSDVAANSSENAAGLQECTASSEELLASAQELKEFAEENCNKCRRSLERIKESREVIASASHTLTEIAREVLTAATAVENLRAAFQGIEGFLEKIKNIAGQTNLLALNATIEAARAGEAGRGFAVVAGEVNKLSQESNLAAQEVEKIVKELGSSIWESSNTIATGVERISGVEELARHSSAALEEIIQELEEVVAASGELSRTTATQAQTTQELSKVIEELTIKTEKTSRSAEETAQVLEGQKQSTRLILDLAKEIEGEAFKLQQIAAKNRPKGQLLFGVTPFVEPQKVKERYLPIINGVAAQLGLQARTIITADYTALIQNLFDGIVDIAWFSPLAYVAARDQGGAVPLVTPIVNGAPSYQGFIITRRDSGIKTLADLRGQTFAFVDEKSASGYAYPRYLLRQAGIDPDKDLADVLFLGTHNKVIEKVLEGVVAAGATFNEAWDIALQQGIPVDRELEIIARTDPIPKDALAMAPGTDPALIEKIRAAFINFKDTPEGSQILATSPIDGFIAASDEKYDIVRQVLGQS